MIDSMMQAITQQLSQMPGNNPFGINPNEMTNVDVQMHMMPFPTPPADTASATSREKESVSTGANSSVDDFENDDSEESDDDSSLSVSSNKLEEDKKIEKTSKGFQGLFKQFRSSRGDSKISKSKSKDDPAKTEKNLSSEENPGDLDVDEKSVCASGKAFLNLVEHLHIDPPREHGLRSVWDQMIDDEIGGKILKANKRSINIEMKKCNIKRVSGALKALEDVLKRQVLSREDVKKALLNAIKLQAGSIAHVECDTPSTTPATQKVASVDANTGEIILSQWALDTAFSTLVNLPTPRLGKLTVRTKEEMNNLAVDKHERALVANVISPQDIGVTYDMIGGLDEVKEMLRQCITYPLKYPRLYQEGVASEAVKGVLLFGRLLIIYLKINFNIFVA